MKVLFLHNNFPAQFRNLAAALSREPGFELAAIGSSTSQPMQSVKLVKYMLPDADVTGTHPFARRFDLECRRAEQVLYSLSSLAASGFRPDVILGHPGWGETLPLRTMFPQARILLYCEFFYGAAGRDIGFDPEFPEPGLDGHIGLQLKNATTLLALADCDLGISPTQWQRSTFPSHYQSKIEIVHEGILTDQIRPDREARLKLPDGRTLSAADEVVTFVARNLEPLRGYHSFMRALPEILARRPNAHVVIIGQEGMTYGLAPPPGKTWRSIFLNEVRDRIDEKRVHFLGKVPYPTFLNALQVSSAHIYLTYPFVLSWSILEAMSAGCVVIGSDTAPVREVVQQGENALLVPFLEPQALAEQTIEVLRSPNKFVSMRETARQYVVENFDASRVCVPKVRRLLTNEQPEPPVRRFWPGQASQKKESDSVANKRAARRAPIGRQQSAKSRRPARKPSR